MYRQVGKRLLDLLGALILLPIVAVAAIIVTPIMKVADPGPVFFTSRRRGLNGRPFVMYKFRSMKVDAPDVRNPDGSTKNSEDDPRVTGVGRILRRTSIDELPQVLNVLFGDMSFVGPRPNMTSQSWDELTEVERRRIEVRPGVTGLSQALHRNAASTALKYRLDALYVERVSLLLDLYVIAKTVGSVLRAKNINSTPSERAGRGVA